MSHTCKRKTESWWSHWWCFWRARYSDSQHVYMNGPNQLADLGIMKTNAEYVCKSPSICRASIVGVSSKTITWLLIRYSLTWWWCADCLHFASRTKLNRFARSIWCKQQSNNYIHHEPQPSLDFRFFSFSSYFRLISISFRQKKTVLLYFCWLFCWSKMWKELK